MLGKHPLFFPLDRGCFLQRDNSYSESLFEQQINCASLSRMSCTAWLLYLQTGRKICPSELLWHRTHGSMHLFSWIYSLLPTQIPGMCPAPCPSTLEGVPGIRKEEKVCNSLCPVAKALFTQLCHQIIRTRRWEFFHSNWATVVELQGPSTARQGWITSPPAPWAGSTLSHNSDFNQKEKGNVSN